jgi:cobalt-zinc-cadmium efflux system outer membrane protein
LAAVSRDYNLSLAAVEKYQSRILPNAKQGLELAEIAYKGGETSFIQVLIARRSFFDTNLQYVAAQALLAQSQSRIDGYVLSGGLDPIIDDSGDDSLRGLTFSQQ